MTITELFKDVLDNAKERLKNPFAGAFMWSLILFNWRPIVVLLFSERAIEDRIEYINSECLTWWRIFFGILIPIVLACIYTIGLPWIMLKIENVLLQTTKDRIANTYKTRGAKITGKLTIADEEFQLQNRRNGNRALEDLEKERESLNEKIISLQDSITQINESNKQTVDNLTATLKKSNETVFNLQHEIDKLSDEVVRYNNGLPLLREDRNIYELIFRKLEKGRANMSQELREVVNHSVEILTMSELAFLLRSDVNEKQELQLHTLDDVEFLKDLSNKGIVVATHDENHQIYKFSATGAIIYNILKKPL